jgi:SSS family solute:Na+ symporter
MYFFALTGAVWMGGIGAVIIGGLYTRWGTTAGAYVALIVGSILASGGMVCDQLWVSWYGKNFFLNGQEVYFYAMIISGMLYVAFSLIGKRIHFDLDKMLHRGQYRIESERLDSDTDTDEQSSVNAKLSFKKAFGISKDFTRGDKIIYGLTIYKSLILFIIFVVMTLVAFFWGLSDRQWSTYHYYMLWFWIGTSFIIAVWLLIGGILDARSLLKTLLASKHEVGDDGRVTLNCQENAAIDNVVESGSQKKS